MKKIILICIITTFIYCVNTNTIILTKQEATEIINNTYKFENCYSAVGDVRRLGLNEFEIEGYEYQKNYYSHLARGIIVKGILKEVIGISISESNKKEATILFINQYVKTPLYNIKGHKRFDETSNCSSWKEKEKEIKMIKYDTGWRIKK